jgi:hypothetical protein
MVCRDNQGNRQFGSLCSLGDNLVPMLEPCAVLNIGHVRIHSVRVATTQTDSSTVTVYSSAGFLIHPRSLRPDQQTYLYASWLCMFFSV